MSGNPVRSIDELFAEFTKAVNRLDLIQNLLRDHSNSNIDCVSNEEIQFFNEQIEECVHNLYESLGDIKLAMDVEAHRKI